jgi:RHS repeat-associated protein
VSFAAYAGDVRTLEIARPNDKIVIDSVRGPIGFLGQVVQRNFYGNGVDEILAVDQVSWSGTTPTTSTFWTFTDHQDSVRDIVSGNAADRGAVVEHRQYDSFGKIVRRTTGPQATAPATAGVGIDFGYAGRPLEARTGLSDNRARWYEPATGRFINEDPSGFRGGDANLFRYVGNDPLNKVDPSGLAAKWASYAGGISTSATMGSAVTPLGWSVFGQQTPLAPTAVSPSVSAMAYASLVRQPTQAAVAASSMLSMAPPAVMVSTSGGTVYSPVATSRPAVAPSTPYSSLQTTVSNSRGIVYTPASVQALAHSRPIESARWTTLDRITKYASANAYRRKDGGLLSQFVPEYDPSGQTGRYSQAGFSATLTRASDYDQTGSPNTYILAYRGTNGLLAYLDWWANARQVANFETMQFNLGIDLAKAVQAKLPPGASLIATGHSKAGAQALAVSHALGIRAIVHNPSSLSPVYQKGTPGPIRTHITFGDPLSVLRTVQNGLELFDPPSLQQFRSAQGEIFVHPPRWFNTHSLDSLPR